MTARGSSESGAAMVVGRLEASIIEAVDEGRVPGLSVRPAAPAHADAARTVTREIGKRSRRRRGSRGFNIVAEIIQKGFSGSNDTAPAV